ncbi:sensor histidine kinase [Georgenia wangjunii]|uniref:sensor histidine kinase n=1 Tax=Georgenia wangjunii TaxID=3117730 RepID=UPI002F25ED21
MQEPTGGGTAARPSYRSVLVRQLPFAGVFLLVILGVLLYAPESFASATFYAGALAALLATTLSIALPWHWMHERARVVVPLLDILAIGLVANSGFPASILLVFPVMWMSATFGVTGAVVSVVVSSIAGWGSALTRDATVVETDNVPRLLLLPVVLTAIATYTYLAERRSSARRALLTRQSALIEEALADASRQRQVLDSILNTIDVGVVALNPDGTIGTINRAHAAVVEGRLKLGDHVSVHGGIGGFREDRVTPLGRDGSPLVRAARGESIDRELTWWDQGGGEFTAFRISAAQLEEGDGTGGGAVVLYQDMTAEMNALAQREDFVSSVSHELRTPLTSILGYLELTTDDPELPERLRGQLGVVERNAQRLQRLIGDLLFAARTRVGFDLEPSTTDLREVLLDSVESVVPRAREAEVELDIVADESIVVLADRTRLAQVADNILSNAVKYSRPDGRVTAVLDRVDGVARLRVRDTGIGIAPAEQEKVFDRFYRARSVRQGPVPGTGLGLHISRLIMAAHGGAIELASEPGVGTEMTLTLPLHAAGDDAPERHS